MFGAIDVGTEEMETADVVAGRMRRALEHGPRSGCFHAPIAGWFRAAGRPLGVKCARWRREPQSYAPS